MRTLLIMALGIGVQLAWSTPAGGRGEGSEVIDAGIDCNGVYHRCYAYAAVTAIPDNRSDGITMGPVAVDGGSRTINRIILKIDITHAYVGDLTISLHYDSDGDGRFDAGTPIDIHLARPESCRAEELCACPIELRGVYYFKDDGWSAAGEDASLAAFEGLDAGGGFYLSLIDAAEGNRGFIRKWAIYVPDVGIEGAIGPAGDVI
jgi:hypothetical protein